MHHNGNEVLYSQYVTNDLKATAQRQLKYTSIHELQAAEETLSTYHA